MLLFWWGEEEKRRVEETGERERGESVRIEERKILQAGKEQERQKRDEENRVRKELERRRREEEWLQRNKEFRAQLEMLSKIAESKPDPSKPGRESELRVVQLSEKDDIKAYLTTIERSNEGKMDF